MPDDEPLDPRWKKAWDTSTPPEPDAKWQSDLMHSIRSAASSPREDRDAVVASVFMRGALAALLLAAVTAFAVFGVGLDRTENAIRMIAVVPRSLIDLAILL